MRMILSAFMSFMVLLMLVPLCPSVRAADALALSMEADKEVRADRNFNIYISCRCSDGIGALRAKLGYDKERLVLKAARLENKTGNDIFLYEDKLEYLHIFFANAPERPEYRLIKLTFAPIKNQDDISCDFDMFFCEACKDSDEYIYADELPFLTVDAVPETKISDASYIGRAESSHSTESKAESKKTVSKSSAGADRTKTSRAVSITQQEKISVNEETPENEALENNTVYYINTKTKGGSDDKSMTMYSFLGVSVIFAAAVIFAFLQGKKRSGKHNDK